jgi:hypothetical protein
MAYKRPGGEVGYILTSKNTSVKYIQPFCIITVLVIALTYRGSASAAYAMPADTTTRNQLLIDALKEGERYTLVISGRSCWAGSRFTMEITKTGPRYYIRLTDSLISHWDKPPQEVFGPVELDAAGMDSIRVLERKLAEPFTGKGHPACKGRTRYVFSVGGVEKEYVDDKCLYNYELWLKRLVMGIATKPIPEWDY